MHFVISKQGVTSNSKSKEAIKIVGNVLGLPHRIITTSIWFCSGYICFRPHLYLEIYIKMKNKTSFKKAKSRERARFTIDKRALPDKKKWHWPSLWPTLLLGDAGKLEEESLNLKFLVKKWGLARSVKNPSVKKYRM